MGSEEIKPKSPWSDGYEHERKLQLEMLEKLQPMLNAARKEFRELVLDKGSTFQETLPLDSQDLIPLSVASQNPDGLLNCIVASVLLSKKEHSAYRLSDLYEAANLVMNKYPDIRITFEESSDRSKVTYTATIIKKSEE